VTTINLPRAYIYYYYYCYYCIFHYNSCNESSRSLLYKRPNSSRVLSYNEVFLNFFFFLYRTFFLIFLLFNMPRSIGRDPFTAMTTTMQLLNNKRKENRAPSPSDTLCDDTKKKKKKKSFGPLVSPHVISQPGKPKRKKHTPSRRRRNTNNNNNNTLTDDIAATSLLLLRTSSTTSTTTFSGGGFGGEEGLWARLFLPSLSFRRKVGRRWRKRRRRRSKRRQSRQNGRIAREGNAFDTTATT